MSHPYLSSKDTGKILTSPIINWAVFRQSLLLGEVINQEALMQR